MVCQFPIVLSPNQIIPIPLIFNHVSNCLGFFLSPQTWYDIVLTMCLDQRLQFPLTLIRISFSKEYKYISHASWHKINVSEKNRELLHHAPSCFFYYLEYSQQQIKLSIAHYVLSMWASFGEVNSPSLIQDLLCETDEAKLYSRIMLFPGGLHSYSWKEMRIFKIIKITVVLFNVCLKQTTRRY